MIKNYLKTAIRNIRKNKIYSFINIFGLGLGLACSLLIILWVHDEEKVDNIYPNGNRLFAVYERQYVEGKINSFYSTPGLMADEMKKVIPEVQCATGYAWTNPETFRVGDKIMKENGNSAGADFFKMFSYPLLEGSVNDALNSPQSIAISRKMAQDFFGSPASAIGKTILFDNRKNFTVTAVFENLPHEVSDKFDFLLNWQFFVDDNSWVKDWGNNGPRTYIMLRADANSAAVKKKITHFLDNYNKQQNAAFKIELGTQRYGDVYLHGDFENGKIEGGRIEYVGLFSIVAIFILLIACINFMNLATAQSIKRAKEIGIRKVIGAMRSSLMRQFIGEAIFLSLIAMTIAFLMVITLLPVFNNLTGKEINLPLSNIWFWLIIISLTFITGLISGSYPALFLSAFRPIVVLRGKMRFGNGAVWFRKGLVIFQFVLSIVLIIGMIVISKQVNYIQTKDLGYDRDNLIYVPLDGDLTKKFELFKSEGLTMPGIRSVSRISQEPNDLENETGGVDWTGKDPNVEPQFTQTSVGYDFIKTMHIQLTDGRDFSKDFATDSVGYILNETAIKRIGYKDPVGKPFTMWQRKGTIIGVIKDFHFLSLHDPIQPLILHLGEQDDFGMALVRTQSGETKQAIASLSTLCKDLNPQFPFTYQFSDEEYLKLYQSEQVVSKLSDYFAFLAIFISCLGLLGLAMFTAEQRTKEIGIRKVLGASISNLFGLLSKEFLQLVVIALLIASPLAWLIMSKWLQAYSYRTPISWWIFISADIAALFIALATISFQAIKAAIANPVKSLRTE
jgi:putative ABC transport system permease protein